MRSATAITLVLLGGGATAMAVHSAKRCEDPDTGEAISCPAANDRGSHSYGFHGGYAGSSGYRSPGFSSVSRGGFGASGGFFHSHGG